MKGRATRATLLALAAVAVLRVRVLPLELDAVPAAQRSQLTFRADDGREHAYLGDFDSYLWLREARNQLDIGTTCEAVVAGACRDTMTLAPVGGSMPYARSLHVEAIVAVHRAITRFSPGYPLSSSAFWVPVVIALVGVLPAFAIGDRLAGPLGGFATAVATGMAPVSVVRSAGADNDAWNVMLPLVLVWAVLRALEAAHWPRAAVWAAMAGGCLGLQAATWSGWPFIHLVVLAGLCIPVVGSAVGAHRTRATHLVLVLMTYWAAAGIACALAGAGAQGLTIPVTKGWAIIMGWDGPAPTTVPDWPDVFATVGELSHPDLYAIARGLSVPGHLFVGWLGVVLVVLPERRWRWPDAVLALAGVAALQLAYGLDGPSRVLVVGLLAVPLAAAAARAFIVPDPDGRTRAGGWVIAVWFLAALYEGFGGSRLVLLLAAPFGIGFGVTAGRLSRSLATVVRPWVGGRAWLANLPGLLAVALLVARSILMGMAAGRAAVPAMNDAWWDTLVQLRETSPPTAIVGAWWPYGHWITYVADRRTYVDGSTLATHVPYWFARALLASTPAETAGLLRMLSCGSDATPAPEGERGAWGRLVARGLDPAAAHETIVTLASLDADAARAYLTARGFDRSATDHLLASTHCAPPPTYLVLTSHMATGAGWQRIGSWEPGRIAAAGPATPAGYAVPAWSPCTVTADGRWTCPIAGRAAGPRPTVEAVEYRPAAPAETRLRTAHGLRTPTTVLVARPEAVVQQYPLGASTDEPLGILVDVGARRVLVGAPALLRSTYTRLAYLEPSFTADFRLVDDRTGLSGERVRTWRIW